MVCHKLKARIHRQTLQYASMNKSIFFCAGYSLSGCASGLRDINGRSADRTVLVFGCADPDLATMSQTQFQNNLLSLVQFQPAVCKCQRNGQTSKVQREMGQTYIERVEGVIHVQYICGETRTQRITGVCMCIYIYVWYINLFVCMNIFIYIYITVST